MKSTIWSRSALVLAATSALVMLALVNSTIAPLF